MSDEKADRVADLLHELVGSAMLQKLLEEQFARMTEAQRAELHLALHARLVDHVKHWNAYNLSRELDSHVEDVAREAAAEIVEKHKIRELFEARMKRYVEVGLQHSVEQAMSQAVAKALEEVRRNFPNMYPR